MSTIRQFLLIGSSAFLAWSAICLIQPVAAETPAAQCLSFASRVDYERKVQAVFHGRRAQPQENAEPKASLEAVLPVEASEAKVADLLRRSIALEQVGNVAITPEMLQAEIDRMSRETRQPEVLLEIYAALDNDPCIIAEVVARSNLVERFAGDLPDFAERWEQEKGNFSIKIGESAFNYDLDAAINSNPAMEDDTWKPMPVLPIGTHEHTAVWTGAEMLVWGGRKNDSSRTNAGSRYNPATDMWLPITGNNAPQPRRKHSAVWTGTEMIVWGGCGPASSFCGLGNGSRYNPATDSWNAVTMTNAPTPRLDHTAVWTGDRMIIWDGCAPNSNFSVCTNQPLGGMYFPATDTWVTVNAASFTRVRHTAVWTGTEMLVWGGYSNIGERFNPNTNSWTQMSAVNAPTTRDRHTAVWTGTEMLVWGGVTEVPLMTLNTGGRYNPATNTWSATSLTNAPQARNLHTAVWTGTEMIVWGGASAVLSGALSTGSRYNPANDTWTATSQTNVPDERADHRAVWTGTEMILWGDFEGPARTGGRYNPATDSWIPTGTNDAPPNNLDSKGVWTGAEMIVFGGTCCGTNVGGRYNPATAVWTPIRDLSEIGHRLAGFTLLWTGTEMIVWGGGNQFVYDDGARYNPASDTWTLTSQINAPSARSRHSAVWTGSEMIIWGGETNNGKTNTGGRYDPSTNSWIATSTAGAPEPRYIHTAVIVGNQMIVWGGVGATDFLNTGGRYNFTTDSWQTVSTAGAPTKRYYHTAISTGMEMIVWGGRFTNVDSDSGLNTGGRYNPTTDVWIPTSQTNAPSPRSRHSAVWTGSEMIMYAGNTPSFFQYSNDGGRYNPTTDSWRPTSLFKIGTKRADHIAVWTGDSMLIWGGQFSEGTSRAGYEYFATTSTPTPTPTFTPTPTATPTNTPTATPTNTPTATPTPTNTPTATPTNTPIATPTNTPTATPTATPTNTPTATPTPGGQGFEGDLAPRPNGDNTVNSTDVIQIRRFATGLDTPNPAFNEHLRADCAPRSTLGDGLVNAGDVVQARRYATGLDPLTDGGGPNAPSLIPEGLSALIEAFSGYTAGREIRLGKAEYVQSTVSIPVEMTALGNEAAVSFTIVYDASLRSNPRISRSDGLSEDAVLTVNLDESGRIGVLVDSATALVTAKKTVRLVVVTFEVVSEANRLGTHSFCSKIAVTSVSDHYGSSLAVRSL